MRNNCLFFCAVNCICSKKLAISSYFSRASASMCQTGGTGCLHTLYDVAIFVLRKRMKIKVASLLSADETAYGLDDSVALS